MKLGQQQVVERVREDGLRALGCLPTPSKMQQSDVKGPELVGGRQQLSTFTLPLSINSLDSTSRTKV